jgi:hypothetical protein
MKRALLALAFVFGTSAVFAGDEAAPPRGMTVLTVSGLIGKTNRGPFDPKGDSLLALQKTEFKNAFAFDRETLLTLPQGTVTVTTNEYEKPVTFAVRCSKRCSAIWMRRKSERPFVALNGYTGWLDPDDMKSSDWILALEADGKPLGLGQQGPIWMVNTREPDFKPNDEHHGHWVYAVFYIKVGE